VDEQAAGASSGTGGGEIPGYLLPIINRQAPLTDRSIYLNYHILPDSLIRKKQKVLRAQALSKIAESIGLLN
jgi:hypothetical protein